MLCIIVQLGAKRQLSSLAAIQEAHFRHTFRILVESDPDTASNCVACLRDLVREPPEVSGKRTVFEELLTSFQSSSIDPRGAKAPSLAYGHDHSALSRRVHIPTRPNRAGRERSARSRWPRCCCSESNRGLPTWIPSTVLVLSDQANTYECMNGQRGVHAKNTITCRVFFSAGCSNGLSTETLPPLRRRMTARNA